MSKSPITYASVGVICPSSALNIHAAIQQIIPASQQGSGRDSTIVVLQKADLTRLFGDTPVASFYVLGNGIVSFVSLRNDSRDETEVFANFIQLNQDVVDKVFAEKPTATFAYSLELFIEDIEKEYAELPSLRMKVLIPEETFANNPVAKCMLAVDYDVWKYANVEFKFDFASIHWVENKDPVLPIVEKARIHLKDIPLNTRNGRIMVRNSITENLVTLTNMHMKSGAQLSFDDWMTQSQGVHMKALNDLKVIDDMQDHTYVEAMVTFKKAEAQAYHSQAIKDKTTDLHLFDWVLLHFGQEFNDLGRKEALAEVQGYSTEDSPLDTEGNSMALPEEDDDTPATFLITFDGTIVEDQQPIIGPESPFAIPTMKKLLEKGHNVIILSMRQHAARDDMLDYLKTNGVNISGSTTEFPADGNIITDEMLEEFGDKAPQFTVDYFIDHRQFDVPMIQISGRADAGSTMYWGDLISKLTSDGYFTDEDVQEIMVNMDPEANQ